MEKKRTITKELIVDTALDLMRDKNQLRGINLREIARTLGCAHTNIYNYFSSYTDLLWETHTAVQEVFMKNLRDNLSSATTAEMKLKYFFDTFLQVYLNNKGWFRLAWLEHIGDERPQSNIDATKKVRDELNQYVIDIWEEMTEKTPSMILASRVMHNTHCYIIGEVSNYVSGRGLIENEAELKDHIVNEAMNILILCMMEG